MKEQILKEFIQELLEDVILGKSENESVSVFRKDISIKVNDFYSKISSQTREETIREVGCCPKCFSKTKDWFNQQNKTGIHCSNCGWHEELNKLKK